jgi:tRNA threonylcarbamoyl adenosine modification protein YeaZ
LKILYFDTSTEWIVVELIQWNREAGKQETLYSFREYLPREASFRLVKEIQICLGSQPDQKIDRIVCAKGPGSFTGIRISVSTARNLSQFWNVPCLGIDTLEIYQNFFRKKDPNQKIVIALDGKMGKYFSRFPGSEETWDLSWNEFVQNLKSLPCDPVVYSLTKLPTQHNLLEEDYPCFSVCISEYLDKILELNMEENSYHSLVPKYLRESYAEQPQNEQDFDSKRSEILRSGQRIRIPETQQPNRQAFQERLDRPDTEQQ